MAKDSDLIEVSGLWLKEGRHGKYMTGNAKQAVPEGARLMIFKNDRKTTEDQPDYRLCFVEDQPEVKKKPDDPAPVDDDIPF